MRRNERRACRVSRCLNRRPPRGSLLARRPARGAWLATACLAMVACPATACRPQRWGERHAEAAHSTPDSAAPPSTKGNGLRARAEAFDSRFTEIASRAGVRARYRNVCLEGGLSILESLGGGAGVFDYDGDGRLDLYFPGGGRYGAGEITGIPGACFRQKRPLVFDEVTAAARLAAAPYYSHGCAIADADNDGFSDLLVTGYGGLQFFHNQGDGTFEEIGEAAGLEDTLWSSSAGWGDLNGDGCPDLYVAHYLDWSLDSPACSGPPPDHVEICSPRQFEPLPDAVYYGNGDGTYRRADAEAGLRADGKGLGVILTDVDLDGDLDIYVANDTVENFLYLNDGFGRLEEVGGLCGVAFGEYGAMEGSMGVASGDFDGDLLPDLWVANYEDETFALYQNLGQAAFMHVSQITGISALGTLFVGFGTAFVDIDHDGDLDLVVSNGHVLNHPRAAPVRQVPLILLNDGSIFRRAVFKGKGYFASTHRGRGLATADLDDDGDVDFVFTHNDDEPAAIVLDDGAPAGPWLRVRLIGAVSNRDGIGATLRLRSSSGERLRQINGGGSYLSQCDPRPQWALPPGDILESLTVAWPSGAKTEVSRPEVNTTLTLIEDRTGLEKVRLDPEL